VPALPFLAIATRSSRNVPVSPLSAPNPPEDTVAVVLVPRTAWSEAPPSASGLLLAAGVGGATAAPPLLTA
jgi:hypothetical protein